MAKSYKVTVFAGTKIVADMAQQVKNATIEASIQIKTVKGGDTSATATVLPPGPAGANRKMEDVEGWFVNGTSANPSVATGTPWDAKSGFKNTNWWDGISGIWSLGSSVPMPSIKGVNKVDKTGDGVPLEMAVYREVPNIWADDFNSPGELEVYGTNNVISVISYGSVSNFNRVHYNILNKAKDNGSLIKIEINCLTAGTINFVVGAHNYLLAEKFNIRANVGTFDLEVGLNVISLDFNIKKDEFVAINGGTAIISYKDYKSVNIDPNNRFIQAWSVANTKADAAAIGVSLTFQVHIEYPSFTKSILSEVYAEKKEIPELDGSVEANNKKGVTGEEVYNKTVTKESISYVSGKNRFNKDDVTTGGYYGVNGVFVSSSTYISSGPIRVEAGKNYYGVGYNSSVANKAMRIVTAYDEIGRVITEAGKADTTNTYTPPQGISFVRVTIWKGNESSFQFEEGSSATEYVPYEPNKIKSIGGSDFFIPSEENGDNNEILFKSNTDGLTPSYIEYFYGGSKVSFGVLPFRAFEPNSSAAFEFGTVTIGSEVYDTPNDNGTPIRVYGTTLGANHGYNKSRITMNSHGKGNVDVGSIWTDGSNQWVLIAIYSPDQLEVSARSSNNVFNGGTLTHISGATNTGNIVSGSILNRQMFPSFKNLVRKVFIDDVELKNVENKTYNAREKVTFTESYEIMEKSSIMEWLITKVGSVEQIKEFDGIAGVSVTNTFVFDKQMGCTQYQDILGLLDNVPFQDTMFLQVQYWPLKTPQKYYIPKTLPVTYNLVNYDFSNIVDITNLPFANDSHSIAFPPSAVSPTGIYADRVVKLFNSNVGFAVGFLPVRSAIDRRTIANRKALEIRGTRKIYLSGIDTASKTTINQGDYYSVVGYRKWFLKDSTRICYYVIESTEGNFLYADWIDATTDILLLPEILLGKKYEIVEKSDSVTALVRPSEIRVKTTGKGYLILKFN